MEHNIEIRDKELQLLTSAVVNVNLEERNSKLHDSNVAEQDEYDCSNKINT
jgi:hypothetical protein